MIFILLMGCQQSAPKVKIEQVSVQDSSSVSFRRLEARAKMAFEKNNWNLQSSTNAWNAVGYVSAQLLTPQQLEVSVLFRLRLGTDEFETEISKSGAVTDVSPEAKTILADGMIDELLNAIAEDARIESALLHESDAALVKRLSYPKESELKVVAELLAQRKNPAALDLILERFAQANKNQNFKEMRRLLGLLVSIQEPKSVNRIISVFEGKDATPELIFAIASIGGSDAKSYLELLAEGHSEQIVRESAQRGLEDLEALKKRKPKP